MKKKTTVIASSVAAIAVCTSLIAGSTYALFTSESKVDIAVTSGKVSVTASVDKESLSLNSMGTELEGNVWSNGGVAGFNSADELELNDITPGDGASFNIKIKNESTINVQYRVKYTVEGQLASVLEVNTDGIVAGWNEWKVTDSVKEKDVTISVNLPEGVGNEYQDVKDTKITFSVVAVQGNADMSKYDTDITVSDAAELNAALANAQYSVIGLSAGDFDFSEMNYLENGYGLSVDRPVELVGAGDATKIIVGEKTPISGQAYFYVNSSNVTISNLTVESLQTKVDGTNYAKGDTIKISSRNNDLVTGEHIILENVTLNNVTVKGATNNGINVHGAKNVTLNNVNIEGTNYKCGMSVAETENLNVVDSHIAAGAWGSVGLMYAPNYKGGSSVTFKDCEIDSWVYAEHTDVVEQKVSGLEDWIKSVGSENTTYIKPAATVNGVVYSSLQQAIAAANDGDVIELADGKSELPSAAAKGKTLTFKGTKDCVFDLCYDLKGESGNTGMNYQNDANLVFDGITVVGQLSGNFGGIVRANTTYKNCTIKGKLTLYGNTTFENCTFEPATDDYSIWTWGAANVTFDTCTFNTAGKAINVYGGSTVYSDDGSLYTNVIINNCTFNDNGKGGHNKAAIEVGDDYGSKYDITITNTTVNGFVESPITGSNIWGNKKSMTSDKLSVIIDGVQANTL